MEEDDTVDSETDGVLSLTLTRGQIKKKDQKKSGCISLYKAVTFAIFKLVFEIIYLIS